MKIAKKVIAAVIVLALLAGLGVLAFAAEPKVVIELYDLDDDKLAVSVILKDAIGIDSWDVRITYDDSVLRFVKCVDGRDVAEVAKTYSNAISTVCREDTPGCVKFAGYFKVPHTDHDTYVEDSKSAKNPADVKAEACEVQVLYFDVLDGSAYGTDFKVEIILSSGVELSGGTYTIRLKEVPPYTEPKPTEPQPTEPQPTEPRPTEPEPSQTEPYTEPNTGSYEEKSSYIYVRSGVTGLDIILKSGVDKVIKRDGTTLGMDELAASGMVLVKTNGTKKVIIVKGDATGDGLVTAEDARYALRTAVDLETPNSWQKEACLVSGGSNVTAQDARLILRAAVGLETLSLT